RRRRRAKGCGFLVFYGGNADAGRRPVQQQPPKRWREDGVRPGHPEPRGGILSALRMRERDFATSPVRAPQTDQMIACRTRAETHSLTSTVAKMAIRITLTRVQASSLRAALSWRPIPPAPTRPSTVDSR